MKTKKSSPSKGELGKIDFVPTDKSKTKISIWESQEDVKLCFDNLIMAFGEVMNKGLPSLAQLQKEAREGRDEN